MVAPFNPKAKLWLQGRKNVLQRMQQAIDADDIVWMHCSSLGEFEQGRPVLEQLRIKNAELKILLTFFSPSGYEVQKNYSGADYIFYLPMDSRANAQKFFDVVKPRLIVFIKYEFWNYYLHEAKKRKVPLLLVSGIFRKSQPFFKWYGGFHRKMLGCFTHLFVQNKESVQLLNSIGIIKNVSLSGDTRFDRVIEIAESFQPIPFFNIFCKGHNVIVAGSTWSEDDEELSHYANANKETRFIIAPHSISSDRIAECKRLYKHSILYSQINERVPDNINTIIIDNIGMLSRLYNYGTICYVGGAFGDDGVHNVLEAAVYGKPVVFGPEYDKFFEAQELVETGGAISITNALELEKTLNKLLLKEEEYAAMCKAAKDYVYSKKGSTNMVMQYINQNVFSPTGRRS